MTTLMNKYELDFNNNIITIWNTELMNDDGATLWLEIEVSPEANKRREEYMLMCDSVSLHCRYYEKKVLTDKMLSTVTGYPFCDMFFKSHMPELTLDEVLDVVADSLDGEYWEQALSDQAAYEADCLHDRMKEGL